MPPDPNYDLLQHTLVLPFTLPAISATAQLTLCSFRNLVRFDRIELITDATYAADPANYYVFQATNGDGSQVVASWSTQTGQQGAIAAGVPANMVMNADSNLWAFRTQPSILQLRATKTGTAANATLRVVPHIRYV